MKVVANSTPPPKARSPITNWFEDRMSDPVFFVNQSNFRDRSIGRHPKIMDTTKSVTMVIIFALRTASWESAVTNTSVAMVRFIAV